MQYFFSQFSYIFANFYYEIPPSNCRCSSLDGGPRQRSMWLEKAELGQRLVLRGVGEELVQDEGLLTSQHEQRLSETGPSSTDLHRYTRRHVKIQQLTYSSGREGPSKTFTSAYFNLNLLFYYQQIHMEELRVVYMSQLCKQYW